MDVTVCICTHNRPHYVRDCLAGLARQTVAAEAFAVLLVDSGSGPAAASELAAMAAATPRATLLRLDEPGVALARNAGAAACRTRFIAYIDDDAIPAPDWVASILAVLAETSPPPAVLGGRALPLWEAPLPAWWPPSLRGVLSIIEAEGNGDYGDPALPAGLAPYTVNMVVDVRALRAIGGFDQTTGRLGNALLSDEDVLLAWRLRQLGYTIRYDSRIVVQHQIQAARLQPAWLLTRMYWQGISSVLTRRALGETAAVWRALPRRLVVLALCAAAAALPRGSTRCIGARWRFAYALGTVRGMLAGCPFFGRAGQGKPPGTAVHERLGQTVSGNVPR